MTMAPMSWQPATMRSLRRYARFRYRACGLVLILDQSRRFPVGTALTLRRWTHSVRPWVRLMLIVPLFGLLLYNRSSAVPRLRTLTVGSERITLSVKGYARVLRVTEYVDGRSTEYWINGDKVTTVLTELEDGSVRSHVYKYVSDG